MLNIWPLLPIVVVWDEYGGTMYGDNIIAALEHNNRICQLDLFDTILGSQLEDILAAMRKPFPELTCLQLKTLGAQTIPDSFLGGSAPRLQRLVLERVPFPGLPKLLLSATHLVNLELWRIPPSGYISPDVMATCLSVLTRLESLVIGFDTPLPPFNQKSQPSLHTHTHLPVLTRMLFFGVAEYLEDFVARIDAPLLDKLEINFNPRRIQIFHTPQLTQFISRTPNLKAQSEVHIISDSDIMVKLPPTFDGELELTVPIGLPDWQLRFLVQICGSSLPQTLVTTVEHL
jgi:hypothetical protein